MKCRADENPRFALEIPHTGDFLLRLTHPSRNRPPDGPCGHQLRLQAHDLQCRQSGFLLRGQRRLIIRAFRVMDLVDAVLDANAVEPVL